MIIYNYTQNVVRNGDGVCVGGGGGGGSASDGSTNRSQSLNGGRGRGRRRDDCTRDGGGRHCPVDPARR